MSSTSLPQPVRIVASNILPTPEGFNEPEVEVVKAPLEVASIFDDNMRRAHIGTDDFPANNNGILRAEVGPGSGISNPKGTNIYYLDIAPGFETPMHRTVSTDYMIVQNGTPTLVSPKGAFNVVDGKATYETVETRVKEKEVVVQRGQMHAWKNDTDSWARILCVVIHAETQEAEIGTSGTKKLLEETWL